MPGSFWILALQILAAVQVFCIKSDLTCLPKEGGGPLQSGSGPVLTAYERKVTSMGKRWFGEWLRGRSSQVPGGVAALHFLWMDRRLELLNWDGTEYWEIQRALRAVAWIKKWIYLVSFMSLVNGDSWWTVEQGAEQTPWVSVPWRESNLPFQ